MGNTNSGRGGLPHETRREIVRLLAAGWRNSAIARRLGIDVSTVSRYKRRRENEGRGASSDRRDSESSDVVRCGGCGGLVLVAAGYCRACYLRKTTLRDVPRPKKRF